MQIKKSNGTLKNNFWSQKCEWGGSLSDGDRNTNSFAHMWRGGGKNWESFKFRPQGDIVNTTKNIWSEGGFLWESI